MPIQAAPPVPSSTAPMYANADTTPAAARIRAVVSGPRGSSGRSTVPTMRSAAAFPWRASD